MTFRFEMVLLNKKGQQIVCACRGWNAQRDSVWYYLDISLVHLHNGCICGYGMDIIYLFMVTGWTFRSRARIIMYVSQF